MLYQGCTVHVQLSRAHNFHSDTKIRQYEAFIFTSYKWQLRDSQIHVHVFSMASALQLNQKHVLTTPTYDVYKSVTNKMLFSFYMDRKITGIYDLKHLSS
jgi:hypothetical protein